MNCVPWIWRERRIGRTFSFRATTNVVGAGKPPQERWTSGSPRRPDLFPVLDDLEDREPRLVDRKEAPPWRSYQWPHRDFMLSLRGAGCRGHEGGFRVLAG